MDPDRPTQEKSEQMQIPARISADGYVTTPLWQDNAQPARCGDIAGARRLSMATPHRGRTS
jgi:hypothetical protein